MAATGFTPISLYHTTTAAAVPVNTNLVSGELALNTTDGKLYYKNTGGTVTLLASTAGSSGDVVGPASATDTAVALFDGTTGKLIKNSPVTIGTTGNTIISGTDGTNAMLRITQLGAGNAFEVEDSTNPDSTPFVIDATGNAIIGSTTAQSLLNPVNQLQSTNVFQVNGTSYPSSSASILRSADLINGSYLILAKSRGSLSAKTIVNSGDTAGTVSFQSYDGTNFVQPASISAAVDGTPGTGDMPGRLVFSTTADGASIPTERMRINSAGGIGMGGQAIAGETLRIGKAITGATSANNVYNVGTVQSDVTTSAIYYRTVGQTQAASFTLAELKHFEAVQGTFGAGSAVTTQYGFMANGTLVGATNNYGFYSAIPAGTGDWNFYAAGSANNYFAGNVGVGITTPTSGLQTAGSSSTTALKTPNIAEVDTIAATVATGTINYDITTQSVLFYTSNASGNWTVNFRGSSGTTLDAVMQTGECISATFLVTQGATAYYNSALTIDGTSVTPKWQGGTAPTSGNASSVDCYTYVIQKTGSATYAVLASQTKFA